MPTGVYPRSQELMDQVRGNLRKGHLDQARKKAIATLRDLGKDPEFRRKVSNATKVKMMDPEIRARHLMGLAAARVSHGVNFRGGNGQVATRLVLFAADLLAPLGFVRELVVLTREQRTDHKPPNGYKVDFGNPETMVAIELDGPSHRTEKRRQQDKKKTEVLESMGWRVIRIQHK